MRRRSSFSVLLALASSSSLAAIVPFRASMAVPFSCSITKLSTTDWEQMVSSQIYSGHMILQSEGEGVEGWHRSIEA